MAPTSAAAAVQELNMAATAAGGGSCTSRASELCRGRPGATHQAYACRWLELCGVAAASRSLSGGSDSLQHRSDAPGTKGGADAGQGAQGHADGAAVRASPVARAREPVPAGCVLALPTSAATAATAATASRPVAVVGPAPSLVCAVVDAPAAAGATGAWPGRPAARPALVTNQGRQAHRAPPSAGAPPHDVRGMAKAHSASGAANLVMGVSFGRSSSLRLAPSRPQLALRQPARSRGGLRRLPPRVIPPAALAGRALSLALAVTPSKARVAAKAAGARQYCRFFNRFGHCRHGDVCPDIHDPARVAVCTKFLRVRRLAFGDPATGRTTHAFHGTITSGHATEPVRRPGVPILAPRRPGKDAGVRPLSAGRVHPGPVPLLARARGAGRARVRRLYHRLLPAGPVVPPPAHDYMPRVLGDTPLHQGQAMPVEAPDQVTAGRFRKPGGAHRAVTASLVAAARRSREQACTGDGDNAIISAPAHAVVRPVAHSVSRSIARRHDTPVGFSARRRRRGESRNTDYTDCVRGPSA